MTTTALKMAKPIVIMVGWVGSRASPLSKYAALYERAGYFYFSISYFFVILDSETYLILERLFFNIDSLLTVLHLLKV